jgi:7-cyano-7-deazaguanine reductase
MTQELNQAEVVKIAGKHLGQVGGAGYSDTYDPSLLVEIPRYLNREAYGIDDNSLPFVGGDVWNAYEVSAITTKGLPVVGMLKIWYPADSKLHVESKSIKLYLNSFNMTQLGETDHECIKLLKQRVKKDLSDLLQTKVQVEMFTSEHSPSYAFKGYAPLDALVDLNAIEFTSYHSDATQLETEEVDEDVEIGEIKVQSNLLRSNCRVTNQPDWGDVFIHIKPKAGVVPNLQSLAKYIVSHRQVSHFHEEICEMIYMHLKEAYNPEELMVACLYTRRGGLDINPIRASHKKLIPGFFTDITCRMAKTLRQ